MAKPKITRLGDPANPYTKKKVSAQEAARSARELGVKPPKRKAESAPAKKKKSPKEVEGSLGRAWRIRTDRKIKEAGG